MNEFLHQTERRGVIHRGLKNLCEQEKEMKVCIYTRVVNNNQASLDAQVEMLKDYASAKGCAW